MKKLLSVMMTVAMILSMGTVAFAADVEESMRVNGVTPDYYLFDGGDIEQTNGRVPYGETFYYLLTSEPHVHTAACGTLDGWHTDALHVHGVDCNTSKCNNQAVHDHSNGRTADCNLDATACNNSTEHTHGAVSCNDDGCIVNSGVEHTHGQGNCNVTGCTVNSGQEHTHGIGCTCLITASAHTVDCCNNADIGHDHSSGLQDTCNSDGCKTISHHVHSSTCCTLTPHTHSDDDCCSLVPHSHTDANCCNITPHTHDATCCNIANHAHDENCCDITHTTHSTANGCGTGTAWATCTNKGNNDPYPLVHENKYVERASVRSKWTMSGSMVAKTDIVKKKINSNIAGKTPGEKYYYMLAITTKPNSTTKINDLMGEVTMRKSGDYHFNGNSSNEIIVDVNVELAYNEEADDFVVTDKTQTFDFGDGNSDEEIRFEEHDYDYFTVDTGDQGDINLRVTSEYNHDIGAMFPKANLHFFNGNYATFNRIGELTLAGCDLGSSRYVYAVDKDDNITQVKATYDSYEEAFKIKTRTLGVYFLSDVKLDLSKVNQGSSSSSSSNNNNSSSNNNNGKPNPPTGGVA